MSKKKTHEEFILEMYNINPNIEILGIYINASTKILCKCVIDSHEWEATPNHLLRGRGCPKCYQKKLSEKLSKTNEEFLDEISLINTDIEILEEYVGAKTKILVRCKKCGHKWHATPSNLLNNRGCPKCSGTMQKTHKDFVDEMFHINPNIEILGSYINSKTKLLVRCKIDGYEWYAFPYNLIMGRGCPKCKSYLLHNLKCKTHEEFVEEMSLINTDIEILGKYTNSFTKLLCRCKLCKNEWYVAPTKLLFDKTGCPHCYKSKGEQTIKIFLEKHNIDYVPQYKYDGLLGIGNKQLSYDFYLLDFNILIEYQGQHHYKPTRFNGISILEAKQRFIKQQEHDRRKREYAKTHNITLVEIPYWDFDNIDKILESRLLKQSA